MTLQQSLLWLSKKDRLGSPVLFVLIGLGILFVASQLFSATKPRF